MNGQWRGKYRGSRQGTIAVNVDERPLHYEGVAYLDDDDRLNVSSVAVPFRTSDKHHSLKVRTSSMLPIDPFSGFPTSLSIWEEQIKKHYPRKCHNIEMGGCYRLMERQRAQSFLEK